MIHSLDELPTSAERAYYIYVLDYGWHEPLGEVLMQNFGQMASQASSSNAVVMRGTVGSHFVDEVLSWHSINGQKNEDLLPAILITSRHPQTFRDMGNSGQNFGPHPSLVLVPLKKFCKTTSDVVTLVQRLFRDIRERKVLADFEIAQKQIAGDSDAIADALILQPNISGIGVDVGKLLQFLKNKAKGKIL